MPRERPLPRRHHQLTLALQVVTHILSAHLTASHRRWLPSRMFGLDGTALHLCFPSYQSATSSPWLWRALSCRSHTQFVHDLARIFRAPRKCIHTCNAINVRYFASFAVSSTCVQPCHFSCDLATLHIALSCEPAVLPPWLWPQSLLLLSMREANRAP